MINRVVLVGRLTRDPELRKTTSGASVASFTLAVDNRMAKDSSEKSASFIPCIAWNLTADNVVKYTRKGSLVAIDGFIVQRTYERKDKTIANVIEVIADAVQFLTPKVKEEKPTEEEAKTAQDKKLPF